MPSKDRKIKNKKMSSMEKKEGRRENRNKTKTEVKKEHRKPRIESDTNSVSFYLDENDTALLKKRVMTWMDYGDKIKKISEELKKYKQAKKAQEDTVIKMLRQLNIDQPLDVHHEEGGELRGRIYRYVSKTKGSIKHDIIRDALMETIHDEGKVDQLVKKIESKRPVKEREYLKRTKGNTKK